MPNNKFLNDLLLAKVRLARLGPATPEPGLWLCSLPLPRDADPQLCLNARPTYRQEIGQWPAQPASAPRRLILAADGNNAAPDELRVTRAGASPASGPPTADLQVFEESTDPGYFWERHLLRVSWNGVSIGLALGLKTGNQFHWWEACNVVTRQSSDTCRVIEMGGAIPLRIDTAEGIRKVGGYYSYDLLHHHNWLNGHIYARLHANGVCEVYAHHINSKFFDDGLPLENAVPVIGIKVDAPPDDIARLCGPWDGTRTSLEFGPVRFDLRDASHLASAARPGSFAPCAPFLVWQPYEAMELYGGACPLERTGDPFIVHAEQRIIPRGMARTIRFSFSLSKDRSPAIARYLPPAWWYAACEEFSPAPLLPVSNDYDEAITICRGIVQRTVHRNGFEDGAIPRYASGPNQRPEPGWEGEAPYGQFLCAWQTGDAADYDIAMRGAYHFTDIAVDHAANSVRMHGFPPIAFALPMQRIHACVAAYLETGDPYLFNTAEAVLDGAYRLHKNSWPRMAIGRDACFIRGAVLLYRYFGDEHYWRIAQDGIADVVASQHADGSFGDQGGGAGIHGWAAYIAKPWMGLMAVGGILDYFEMGGEDPAALAAVKKLADWLMSERGDHNGVMGWGFLHTYRGGHRYRDLTSGAWGEIPGHGAPWHLDYLARFMMFCSLRFGDPSYFDAWVESYKATVTETYGVDHRVAQTYQYVPWLQARLWNARLTPDGIRAEPVFLGPKTPQRGDIQTPEGIRHVAWDGDGRVTAEPAEGILLQPRTIPFRQ